MLNDNFGGNETNENQINYFPIGSVAALEAVQPCAYKPSCSTGYDITRNFTFLLFPPWREKRNMSFPQLYMEGSNKYKGPQSY